MLDRDTTECQQCDCEGRDEFGSWHSPDCPILATIKVSNAALEERKRLRNAPRGATARLPSSPPRDGGLLTAEQAAEVLSVPPSWLLAQAREGKVPHFRLGRYVRFDSEELRGWLMEQRRSPERTTP